MSQRETAAAKEVRGEYNKTFDADEIKMKLSETPIFVTPEAQQYVLLVKPAKKTVINGEVVTEDDITIFFRDFLYRCESPEIAELIRKTPAYKAGRVKELGALKQEQRERTISEKAAEVANDPDLARAVLTALKKGKSSTPEVSS